MPTNHASRKQSRQAKVDKLDKNARAEKHVPIRQKDGRDEDGLDKDGRDEDGRDKDGRDEV